MIRCPACGAQSSLDAIIDDQAASLGLQQALTFSPEGPLLVRYLGLFRPVKTRLTWPRVNALLGELLPVITAERLERGGVTYHLPRPVWSAALEAVLAARDAGQLRTPLKSHGYLYEVAIGLAGRLTTAAGRAELAGGAPHLAAKAASATAQAISVLEDRKRQRPPCAG